MSRAILLVTLMLHAIATAADLQVTGRVHQIVVQGRFALDEQAHTWSIELWSKPLAREKHICTPGLRRATPCLRLSLGGEAMRRPEPGRWEFRSRGFTDVFLVAEERLDRTWHQVGAATGDFELLTARPVAAE
jgi:hypothetical protein